MDRSGMAPFKNGYWWSNDGLRLHYRDYAADSAHAGRPPIICIPGLTRNARDWEGVAQRLAGQWRVICVDLRGRGESAYAKDPMTYVPLTYLQDLEALLRTLSWTSSSCSEPRSADSCRCCSPPPKHRASRRC
jgi:pimeloyl-ACP methyl ester carboxylesterase